jgi:hypothetical protein
LSELFAVREAVELGVVRRVASGRLSFGGVVEARRERVVVERSVVATVEAAAVGFGVVLLLRLRLNLFSANEVEGVERSSSVGKLFFWVGN